MNTRKWIVGVDEVGRGPIAGPVTLCAFVSSSKGFKTETFFKNGNIKDSKKLNKDNRNNIYQTITKYRKSNYDKIDWVLASKSAEYIDAYGISKAIKECLNILVSKLAKKGFSQEDLVFYLDGALKIDNSSILQETFIKGDEKIAQIALASIIAKVKRDTYMEKMDNIYPGYVWSKNAGYGTKQHYIGIEEKGLTLLHRKSFINKDL